MKLKGPVSFKCKKLLINPCTKILQIFKFRFKKPLFIRTLLRPRKRPSESKKSPPRKLATGLTSLFGSLRWSREKDRLRTLNSFSDASNHKVLFPSPLTPAYVRMSGARKREVSVQEDVEDACRSFENYLVEMIVDEGKVRDLTDVEELLDCWKNLKCPVFRGLVCRFYGELCKDLFFSSEETMNTP
ncbi:transcription repressor OFP17-like [Actinidia eriantha]|uniref:transcription repressor OFP17-like n=1 Tax=Actinidia eriantha TaxID=165200 RepID=UPI00258661FA|nr:transcription repressor OFP17-like [Actinidia eriantha]